MSPDVQRIVLFGDPSSFAARRMLHALLRLPDYGRTFALVAFVDTAIARPPPFRFGVIASLLRSFFDRDRVAASGRSDLPAVRRQLRGVCPLVVPTARQLNHPDFIRALRDRWKPDFSLLVSCEQVFGRELLAVAGRACNFHNSLLPRYRGIRASSWAVYFGEPQAGYTFHIVNERIDDGPILLQESVAIDPSETVAQLDRRVIEDAAEKLGLVLQRLARGDAGEAPRGEASYFGARALRDIRSIPNAGDFTLAELQRRLRAFKWLDVKIGRRTRPVTKFARAPQPGGRGIVMTRDGIPLRATRYFFLPRPLYHLYRLLVRRAPPL